MERGDAHKQRDWHKRDRMNKEISQCINDNLDELLTPKKAYVTLEHEKAYNMLLEKETIPLYGGDSVVKEASDPLHIIFENMDMKQADRYPLIVSAISQMMLIFGVTVLLQWLFQYYSRAIVEKY